MQSFGRMPELQAAKVAEVEAVSPHFARIVGQIFTRVLLAICCSRLFPESHSAPCAQSGLERSPLGGGACGDPARPLRPCNLAQHQLCSGQQASGAGCRHHSCRYFEILPAGHVLVSSAHHQPKTRRLRHTTRIHNRGVHFCASRYATGGREDDAPGTGPGLVFAAELALALNRAGIQSFSGIHVPSGSNWKDARVFIM